MADEDEYLMLDVRVWGPGFGEAILLCWYEATADGSPARRAALIDAGGRYVDPRHKPDGLDRGLHQLLSAAGDAAFAFVACTHPHLDHIGSMANVLLKLKPRLERVLWWGVPDRRRYDWLFDRLERVFRSEAEDEESEAQIAAQASSAFLSLLAAAEAGGVDVREVAGIQLIYEAKLYDGSRSIRVWSIGPHPEPRAMFREAFEKQYDGRETVTPDYYKANRTSLGFLIQFGDAQIVLAGDLEKDNWDHFESAWNDAREQDATMPLLRPHFVKASHHGSKTGNHDDMWPQDVQKWGFFGTAATPRSGPRCVVTPWNRAPLGSRLPQDLILRRIFNAGCRVFCTGVVGDGEGAAAKERPYSEAQFLIHASSRIEEPVLTCAQEWRPFASGRKRTVSPG